jgi:hypothetical protein
LYAYLGGNWMIAQERISVPVDFATGKAVLFKKA